MISLTDSESRSLRALGERLRFRRLQRNEKQTSMAARIGVSLTTYRKMEQGDLNTLEEVFPVSLFEEAQPRRRVRDRSWR